MTALFLGVLGYVPLWGQNIDFTPDKPDGPANIQSALWELAMPGAGKRVGGLQDTVVVILVPHLGQASASIDTSSLVALGGRVLAQSKSLMRVSVPAAALLAVAELPGVRFVRRPYRPHSQATISEGASRIGALANHSAGVKGQGVKVAIIDGGFKGAKELSGDMPARWWYHDYTGEGIYAGDSVHGTACAEIIHDVAPEAELYLYKTGDMVDFENAKDRAIRNGIDIINYSSGWFGTGIGDGRGLACDIVDDAADKGILWVTSAGNNAKSHYDGFWSDSDDDGWHNFGSENEVLSFEAEKGDEISVFLTWNDWPSSRENYDLYLYIDSSDGLERVAESTDRQNISGGEPVESIEYKVEKSGEYGIAISSEGARPKRLKIWSLDHDFAEYAVAKNSIVSPADAKGSMSVGAIYHRNWNAGRIEDYSSRGPTTDGRIKPELVAPTGVSTVSHAPYVFDGTSFAAPHVAGAAALIKSANPSYSRTQLWNALIAAAVDIGPRGRDNDSGYGKLVLPTMRVSANTSPRISSVSPQTVQTDRIVTVSGSNFGSSRGSSTVRIGSVVIPSSELASWSNTRIRFRIPVNTPPGNLTVRTSQGTSNTIRLQITSPYLTRISPTQVKTGGRLTLTGGNFGTRRGSRYVLFTSNVRPAAADYVSWSNSRIVVKVPARARSGNVQVTTSNGTSGTKLLLIEIKSPQITSISPSRVQYNQTVTIRGTSFGANRGTSRVIFQGGKEPSSSQYVSWSDTRIQVRVPAGARTGNVQVVTTRGRASSTRLTITSPWISSVSPQTGKTNTVVTISGGNFGSSRGSSSVRIGSATVPSSAFTSWSSSRIRFRIPRNTPPGNLIVRTSQGTSNAIRLQITSPYLTGISPTRARTGERLTLTGGNFGTRRGTGYVLFASNVRPSAADYVSWSNSRIVVKVPARAQSGNVQVATSNGRSGTKRLEIESRSPQISSVSPSRVQYSQTVTITGSNFGSSRGSSSVRIGSIRVPSFTGWSNTIIRFRVPTNMRSGNVTVRTSAGTSNAIRLEITSPYLGNVSPVSVRPGDRLTLTGANFRSTRGSGYVLFAPNVRPASGDYVSWSNTRIVVKVPIGAQSGDVKVVATGSQVSGTKRIVVEGEVVESLPSRGLFGYSPPAVTKNPKSVKFGFEGIGEDMAMTWSVKSDAEVEMLVNGFSYGWVPESDDWEDWWITLYETDLNAGQNVIEFRNRTNQNRTSSFTHWLLKDVKLWMQVSAKPIAGAKFLGAYRPVVESGIGDPFPTPFNAEVTIPFTIADVGSVRLAVYNLMGQSIRVLANGWTEAGLHQMRWDGRTDAGAEVASGVYWAVLHIGDVVQTAKLALIR